MIAFLAVLALLSVLQALSLRVTASMRSMLMLVSTAALVQAYVLLVLPQRANHTVYSTGVGMHSYRLFFLSGTKIIKPALSFLG